MESSLIRKKTRVSGLKNNVDDRKVINNVVPLRMILPEDSSSIKAMATYSNKNKISKPVILSNNKSYNETIAKTIGV